MPPKKAVKKKKKADAPAAAAFPVPRDLSEPHPIDGAGGTLGLEHLDVRIRIAGVTHDLVAWALSETARTGAMDCDLADHGLDELPEEIFDLPWLQVLDLSKNRFVAGVFEEVAALTSLKALDLSMNVISGPLPDTFGSLPPAIEEICLDDNVITELPVTAAALRELTYFSVRRNMLSVLPGAALAAWSQLSHLDLRDNKLKTVPVEIGECLALKELLLSGNAIDALPESLGNLTSLEVLHVQRNALTALPESLSRCSAMVDLDISMNKIGALPGFILASFASLRTLHAASNKIAELPEEIGVCTELEVLTLSGNNIKSLPESVGALVKLREVYMSGNPIASLPASVINWGALEECCFKNCKLKGLPEDVAAAWSHCSVLDVRGKKKDTCKVTQEFKDTMKSTRLIGTVLAKAKKKKAAKK